MIEFFSLFGFLIVNIFMKNFHPIFYGETMCATTSLCLVFILFGRVFLHIVKDKVWRANLRHFLMCLFYFILILDSFAAIVYFSGLATNLQMALIRVFAYSLSIGMFIFVKAANFACAKLYDKSFIFLHIIDTLLIIMLTIFDILACPEYMTKKPAMVFMISILILLSIVNFLILNLRSFWMHKKSLFIKIETKIKNNDENSLLIQPKTIQNSSTIREAAYVLDLAPIRVVEVNIIIKYVHDMLVLHGRSTQEATQLAADFGAIIIKTLMKRKYDFSLLPRPIVKLLQTYKKYKGNNRQITLSV